MQMKFRILHFFLVLLMGCFGVIGLVLFEVFEHETPAAEVYLPKQADWAMRVDLESLAKDELYTLLFEAKDDQLITMLRKIADKRVEQHNEKGPLTIDFRQDVVVFGMEEQQHVFTGILLQIIDPETFTKNIGHHLQKGQSAAVSGHTALILHQVDKPSFTQNELQQLAATCLKTTRRWDLRRGKEQKDRPFLSLQSSSFSGGTSGKMDVSFFKEAHAVRLEGFFRSDVSLKPANYSLQHTGLFLSTAIIPDGLTDSLNRLLPIGNFRMPELRAITLDYKGLSLAETAIGIRPIPNMNLILESTHVFSVDSILRSVPAELIKDRNTLQVAELTYHLKQLDEHTVFIGLDTNAIVYQKAASICLVSGPLQIIGQIDASPGMMAIMEMVPQVRSGREFLGKTRRLELEVKNQKQNDYTFDGLLTFKDDAYPLHEFVRLLMGLGVID
jgi:hypothetical protein